MPQFAYKAKTSEGKLQRGVMNAANREELLIQLRSEGLFCYEISDRGEEQTVERWSPIKLKQIAPFCRQLSAMLRSGVNMARALDIIYNSTKKKQMRAAAFQLYEGVHRGQALSETMAQMGKAWPELLIYMVETGETSGTLDVIMERMASHFENEVQLKSKIQGAMIYPIILLIVAIAAVVFILTFALPQFLSMYEGYDLPITTQMLLAISDFITGNWAFLLVSIVVFIGLWMFLMTQRPFNIQVKKLLLRVPIFGPLLRTIYTSRFASTFSILYGSGISILKSIEITGRVLGSTYIEERLKEAGAGLAAGDMLSDCLTRIKVFNTIFISMVLVGEESGALDDILAKNGAYFEQEANAALSKMVAMIEPIMIILMAVIIGFIVISIIMPIFTMYSQIL